MTTSLDSKEIPFPSHDFVPTATTRQFLMAALGYLLILILLFHRLLLGEVLSPGANMRSYAPFSDISPEMVRPFLNDIQGDTWRYFAPNADLQHQAWREGRFPFWNSNILMGMPVYADGQSAFLNPWHLPFYFYDYWQVIGPLKGWEMLVSALAFFCLARRLTVSPLSSFLTGLVWILGSANLHWLQWTMSHATLWVPVLSLALDRFLVLPSARRFVVCALGAAMLQLSGHPEMQFLMGVTAGVFILCRAVMLSIDWRTKAIRLVLSLFTMLTGTGLAAFSLVPFVMNLLDSAEWRHSLIGKTKGMPVADLLLFLAPDYYGRPRAGYEHLATLNFSETCCWFGFLPLILAVAVSAEAFGDWSSSNWNRLRIFVRAMSLFWILAILISCDILSIRNITDQVPIFSSANLLRLLVSAQFAGAILAGVGFDRIRQKGKPLHRWIYVLAALGLLCVRGWLLFPLSSIANKPIDSGEHWRVIWHHPLVRNIGSALLASLCAGALIFMLWRMRNGKLQAKLDSSVDGADSDQSPRKIRILFLLLLLDLLWYGWDLTPTCPLEILTPKAPIIEEVRTRAGHYRMAGGNEVLVPNLAVSYGLCDVRGYELPTPTRLANVLSEMQINLGLVLFSQSKIFPEMEPMLGTFLDKASVKFLWTDQREPKPRDFIRPSHGQAWPLAFTSHPFGFVYENPNAYLRAWMAEQFTLATPEQALSALLDPTKDLRLKSYVESESSDSMTGDSPAKGNVKIVHAFPEQVTLEVDSQAGGLVVLTDRSAPGWSLTIDEVAAETIVANYLFRSALVKAGRHTLVWTYRPPGLTMGLCISGLSSLLCVILALLPSRRERRER